MPHFAYKAKKGPVDIVSGTIMAETQAQAVSQLIKSGQIPIDIKLTSIADRPAAAGNGALPHRHGVTPQALASFTKQLADLLGAGVVLLRAMQLLSNQNRFPAMKPIIQSMINDLQQGKSLSAALGQYPQVFTPVYFNTVKAAEGTGQLPLVMDRLSRFLENDLLMRAKVRASLLYPAIIFGIGLFTIFVLMSFVLPRLTVIYEDFDAQLPWLTSVVIAVSHVFAQGWWAMLIGVAALVFWARGVLQTPAGREHMHRWSMKIPLLKTFIENVQLSRFARTSGMLLESGVPVLGALESSALVVDNSLFYKEVKAIALKVKEGVGLAQAVREAPLFPESAADLITVGQESGKLEQGLYKLADMCERQANEMANVFVTSLGPGVLIMVVGIVGVMVTAILLPMLQMNAIVH